MKYFDVRFAGGGTIGDWPADPPPLQVISAPATLPGVLGKSSADLEPAHEQPAMDHLAPAHRSEWVRRLCGEGICDNRHACPDLPEQLRQTERHGVDTVLCTLLDGDPTLHLNGLLAMRYNVELTTGVTLLGRLLDARQRWIVQDSAAPRRWTAMVRRRARKNRLRLFAIHNDYPVSDPTLLLHSLLGRKLRPGQLPTEQGVLLLDAAAAVAVGRLFIQNNPLLQVPLAIFDHSRQKSHFVFAWTGTPLSHVLEQLDISLSDVILRCGNLLRDIRVSPDAIVARGENTVHAVPQYRSSGADPCIRCGWCVEGCPTHAYPAGLLEASQRNNWAMAHDHGIDACIECGICSFVCPSCLPLLEGIRAMKKKRGES